MLFNAYNGVLPALVPNVAQTLHQSFPFTLQIVAIAPFAWGISGLVLAPLADVFGDRIFIALETTLMGVFSVGGAFTSNYIIFIVMRLAGGICGGVAAPTVQAYIVKHWDGEEQVRILSYASAGFRLGSLIAIPLLLYSSVFLDGRWLLLYIWRSISVCWIIVYP